MRSTFHGLETAKKALFTQQAALNTLGHNVANANTPGYSRQRVNMATTPSMDYPGLAKSTEAGQLGTGVFAKSIERVREGFLDNQFRNENKSSGEWQARAHALDKLQAIFNEPSDTGLSKVLNNFYLSWQSLGRDPDKLETRAVVKQATTDLVSEFAKTDAKLSELDADLGEGIEARVDEFNQVTSQVRQLNDQIRTLEVLGDKANDLRDRRDLLVDQLSKLANITVREQNGAYNISVGDTLVVNGINPTVPLTYDKVNNTTSFPVAGGEISGQMNSRREYVSVYRAQLDSLVNGMVNGKFDVSLPNEYTFEAGVTNLPYDVKLPNGTVMTKGSPIAPGFKLPKGTVMTFNGLNELHSFGYTMQSPATKAGPLFETADGSTTFTAANIRVAKAILDDVRNIAASHTTYVDANGDTQVKRGNGDIAFMIGESISSQIDFKDGLPNNSAILTKGTVASYMRAMIGQLGAQGQTAERQVQNQEALLNQIENMRQSVSGVSLDEEMSNMIKFQQSYSAAARCVNTIDQLLDTVINRMAAN